MKKIILMVLLILTITCIPYVFGEDYPTPSFERDGNIHLFMKDGTITSYIPGAAGFSYWNANKGSFEFCENYRAYLKDCVKTNDGYWLVLVSNVEMPITNDFFSRAYNPLVRVGGSTGEEGLTIKESGDIIKGILEIGYSRKNIGRIIDYSKVETELALSNGAINFETDEILLHQYGKYETDQKNINCEVYSIQDTGDYSPFQSQITKDSMNVFNFETEDIIIPFSIGYYDECSKEIYSSLKFKDILNFLIKKITNKQDALCMRAQSKFLVYYTYCSNFNERGIIRTGAGNINKMQAEMTPTGESTFVLHYNRDGKDSLNNVLCASNDFVFQVNNNRPITQRCLNIVGEGTVINLYSSNEEEISSTKIAYNQKENTNYNLAGIFDPKTDEEESKNYLQDIDKNNPRLDLIDSRLSGALDILKSG